ncbi:MAG: CxxxxCH/CxxCH domain-containing protein, partial [Azonexaceae bacterium]|nr:CxxxxCH/CxxCH domain-containing protein [Azonexaceae bacterium]
IYAPDREKTVLKRICELNRGPLPEKTLVAIWRELMSGSFALEKPLRIAYLGPDGSFSHLAAVGKFGSSVEYEAVNETGGASGYSPSSSAGCSGTAVIGGSYTCTGTYCHSLGTSTTAPFATPNNNALAWNATSGCTSCHSGDASQANKIGTANGSANHASHINNAAVIGTNYQCFVCHNTVVSGNTTLPVSMDAMVYHSRCVSHCSWVAG